MMEAVDGLVVFQCVSAIPIISASIVVI